VLPSRISADARKFHRAELEPVAAMIQRAGADATAGLLDTERIEQRGMSQSRTSPPRASMRMQRYVLAVGVPEKAVFGPWVGRRNISCTRSGHGTGSSANQRSRSRFDIKRQMLEVTRPTPIELHPGSNLGDRGLSERAGVHSPRCRPSAQTPLTTTNR